MNRYHLSSRFLIPGIDFNHAKSIAMVDKFQVLCMLATGLDYFIYFDNIKRGIEYVKI